MVGWSWIAIARRFFERDTRYASARREQAKSWTLCRAHAWIYQWARIKIIVRIFNNVIHAAFLQRSSAFGRIWRRGANYYRHDAFHQRTPREAVRSSFARRKWMKQSCWVLQVICICFFTFNPVKMLLFFGCNISSLLAEIWPPEMRFCVNNSCADRHFI